MSVAQAGVFAAVAVVGIAKLGDECFRVDLMICERLKADVENKSEAYVFCKDHVAN